MDDCGRGGIRLPVQKDFEAPGTWLAEMGLGARDQPRNLHLASSAVRTASMIWARGTVGIAPMSAQKVLDVRPSVTSTRGPEALVVEPMRQS